MNEDAELEENVKRRIDMEVDATGMFFVPIFNGFASEHLHKQIRYALDRGAKLLAFVEEGTEPTEALEEYPWEEIQYAPREKLLDQQWCQQKVEEVMRERMGFIERLKVMFKGLKRLPYKRYWLLLIGVSVVFFSWWDDLAVWCVTAGVWWLPVWIPAFWVPIAYYGIEFGVLMPLTLLLAKKTFDKVSGGMSLKEMLVRSLKNNIFVMAYRKLKKWWEERHEPR